MTATPRERLGAAILRATIEPAYLKSGEGYTPLPSELLGLIEALIEAATSLGEDELSGIAAAHTALIAGIQRYREEGQERTWWLIELPQSAGGPLWWAAREGKAHWFERFKADRYEAPDEVYQNFSSDANEAIRFHSADVAYTVLRWLATRRATLSWADACVVTEHAWLPALRPTPPEEPKP